MEQINKTRPIAPVLPAAKDPHPNQGEIQRKPRDPEQDQRDRGRDDDHQLDEYA